MGTPFQAKSKAQFSDSEGITSFITVTYLFKYLIILFLLYKSLINEL